MRGTRHSTQQERCALEPAASLTDAFGAGATASLLPAAVKQLRKLHALAYIQRGHLPTSRREARELAAADAIGRGVC